MFGWLRDHVVYMNSVKPICDNFETVPDNVKENLTLYGDLYTVTHNLMKTKVKLF